MIDREHISAENVARAQSIAGHLIERSARPVGQPDAVEGAINTSLHYGTPLRMRMVMCPNWKVDGKGRSIGPIPVHTEGTTLIYDESDLNVVGFATEEIPDLVSFMNQQGMQTELLVVLADIVSDDWVHDPNNARETMKQNLRALKLLLMSGGKGRETFGRRDQNAIKVASQYELARLTPNYDRAAREIQMRSLDMGTPLNDWYLHTLRSLQAIGEYGDKRSSVSGLQKVWDRAFFLSTLYALDGTLVEGDFDRMRFPAHDQPLGYLELGAVATGHGDLIADGLNVLRPTPIGMVTPFNNAMEHSWSEPRREAMTY